MGTEIANDGIEGRCIRLANKHTGIIPEPMKLGPLPGM
jgi:hypothetical protein